MLGPQFRWFWSKVKERIKNNYQRIVKSPILILCHHLRLQKVILRIGEDLQREKDTHCFVYHFDYLLFFLAISGNKKRGYASQKKHSLMCFCPKVDLLNCLGYMKAKISGPFIPVPLTPHNISYFFLAETISIMGLRSSSSIPLTV